MDVKILDGGLGTSLSLIADGSPLWSGNAAIASTDRLSDVHKQFIAAGAQIIETATYQISYDTGARAGLSRQETESVMRAAVKTANTARLAHQNGLGLGSSTPRVEVALSLGPYGATLSPSCEFTGAYPAPYDSTAQGASAEEALTAWHLERLRAYASDEETWRSIDIIAFETIPLVCEARAIRRAMHMLLRGASPPNGDHGGDGDVRSYVWHGKQWWISCTFPGPEARFPDPSLPGMSDIVNAVLEPSMELLQPTGIGINCSPARDLARLARDLSRQVLSLYASNAFVTSSKDINKGASLDILPWIVLYPIGDHESAGGVLPHRADVWSAQILDAVQTSHQLLCASVSGKGSVSPRFILGGCCNTTTSDIAELSNLVRVRQAYL